MERRVLNDMVKIISVTHGHVFTIILR